jgi:hypothetical protein
VVGGSYREVVSGLVEAVERLFGAFADVKRPTTIATCPCCFTDEQAAELLAPSPPPELVLDYAAHAMGTIGGVDDLRYFTPRILRLLLVAEPAPWPELEIVADRLRRAEWTTWPPPEREAIRDVLRAVWAQTLATHPSHPDLDTALCAIGNAEDDLDPYLADWTAALSRGSAPAGHQLSDLLAWGVRSKRGRYRLTNAFWSHRDGPVTSWLVSESTRAAIRSGFDAAAAADDAEAAQVYADLVILLGA